MNIFKILLLIFLFFSCSPEFHFHKFQKKGGKIKCISDTIQKIDTIISVKGDTIYRVKTEFLVRDSIHYLTKHEIKYKYKTIKEQEKTRQTEAKEETKQILSENKTIQAETKKKSKLYKLEGWFLFISGCSVGYVIRFIFEYAIKMYVKIIK